MRGALLEGVNGEARDNGEEEEGGVRIKAVGGRRSNLLEARSTEAGTWVGEGSSSRGGKNRFRGLREKKRNRFVLFGWESNLLPLVIISHHILSFFFLLFFFLALASRSAMIPPSSKSSLFLRKCGRPYDPYPLPPPPPCTMSLMAYFSS